MGKHIVKCRICKMLIDAQPENKDIEWIMPTNNQYFHTRCYNEWKNSKDKKDEDWVALIYDLIARDLRGEYNWQKIEAQRKKCITQRMTNKGIYYSLYWYFIIKKNAWSADYGIGIVPYIYQDSVKYWVDKENKKTGICVQIEKTRKEMMDREPIKINRGGARKKRVFEAPD